VSHSNQVGLTFIFSKFVLALVHLKEEDLALCKVSSMILPTYISRNKKSLVVNAT